MKKKYSEETQRVLDRYQELLKNDPVAQVIEAIYDGNIIELRRLFFDENKIDILRVSELENWNWLHHCNLLDPCPVEVVEFYIENGVPINAQDCYGMTPLHYAMRAKNADAALLLLKSGADPNIPNIDNVIPLANIGYMPERLDVLELMLEKGGDVHFYNGQHQILEGMKKYLSNNEQFIPIIKMMERYL